MKTEHKKLAALIGAGIIAGAAIGGAVGVVSQQSTIDDLSADLAILSAELTSAEAQVLELENQEPVIVTETIVNETIVEVPVETIVEVESANLSIVLDHIHELDGDVEYLLDDLDDDEVELIVDRIVFVNEVKDLAVAEVKAEIFDELDGEEVGEVELDEDEMERLKIDDDLDEIMIDDIDFEDGDALVTVTGSFEQDDVEYVFSAEVSIKDGEVDEIESIEVSEE